VVQRVVSAYDEHEQKTAQRGGDGPP